MRKTITFNKKIGQTPLDVIEEYKKTHPKYKDIKMAYAGRLDPMAEGKLLVVIGEECKNLKQYLNLNKEYVFEILLGFKSDSQDVLGLADAKQTQSKHEANAKRCEYNKKEIKEVLKNFTGKISLPYPIFSSKTVKGKKLFWWTLQNRLNEIKIPKRKVEVYKFLFLGQTTIKKDKLQKEIFEKINSIKKEIKNLKLLGAGFRKNEILSRWEELLNTSDRKEFHVLKFKCQCSSGTYMRILSEKIAEELGEYGIAYSINRTKIY